MMMWCWEMESDKRPSFSTLVQTLSKLLEKMADYLHVGTFAGITENSRYTQDRAIIEPNHSTSIHSTEQAEHAV